MMTPWGVPVNKMSPGLMVMIFEMTQDYAVIVPLMIANLVSLFLASRLQHEPIYEALAVQDGIHLPSAESRQRQGLRQVARVMRPASDVLDGEITAGDAVRQVRSSGARSWLVVGPQEGARRGVMGVVNLASLEREEHSGKKLAEFLAGAEFPHVHSDQGLDVALERMGANQIDVLPVVSRAEVHRLEGIVTLRDVLDAYGVGRGDEVSQA